MTYDDLLKAVTRNELDRWMKGIRLKIRMAMIVEEVRVWHNTRPAPSGTIGSYHGSYEDLLLDMAEADTNNIVRGESLRSRCATLVQHAHVWIHDMKYEELHKKE